MVDFIFEYGMFLAKTITIVAGIGFFIISIITAGQKFKKQDKEGHIEIKSLNEKYKEVSDAMQANILSEFAYDEICKAEKKDQKAKLKKEKSLKRHLDKQKPERARVFVVDFVGDIRASANDALAEQITAILTQATSDDEVVIRLESGGGMVHSYGLASSQLQRIRDKNIPLTICVDKVAASGGYMMACIANKLLAAPFAVIGSIGVVAQIPNIHRLLKKHDVDFEMLTAGEYKRTLTVLGENTEKGRQKFQQEIQETHDLFKDFVAQNRPNIDMNVVATGEVWFGKAALEKGLIDAVITSDDYLFQRHTEADLYKIDWIEKHSIAERFGLAAESAMGRVLMRFYTELENRSLFFR
jgi:serine protease SohB